MADTPQVEIPSAPMEPIPQERDTHAQSEIPSAPLEPIVREIDTHEQQLAFDIGGAGPALTTFKMRGRDDGRTPGIDYIIWLFTGAEPDFAGTGFAGGDPTPIGNLIAGSVVLLAELTG